MTLADRIKKNLRTPQCFHTLSCMYALRVWLTVIVTLTEHVRWEIQFHGIFKCFLSIISHLQKIALIKFIPPQLKYFSNNSCGFSKSVYIIYVFDFHIGAYQHMYTRLLHGHGYFERDTINLLFLRFSNSAKGKRGHDGDIT